MEKEEIYKNINDIEIRQGIMRGIKSYVIRNNVLDDNQKKSVEAYFPDCLTTEEKKQVNSYTYTLIDNPDFLTHSTMMNKSKGLTKGVLDYLKDNDEFLYNEAVNTYRQNLDRELQKEIGIKI